MFAKQLEELVLRVLRSWWCCKQIRSWTDTQQPTINAAGS